MCRTCSRCHGGGLLTTLRSDTRHLPAHPAGSDRSGRKSRRHRGERTMCTTDASAAVAIEVVGDGFGGAEDPGTTSDRRAVGVRSVDATGTSSTDRTKSSWGGVGGGGVGGGGGEGPESTGMGFGGPQCLLGAVRRRGGDG